MPNKATPHMYFGEFLIHEGLITRDVLEAALSEQKITHKRLGGILVKNAFISRKDLLQAVIKHSSLTGSRQNYMELAVSANVMRDLQSMVVAETATQIFVASMAPERWVYRQLKPYYPDKSIVFVQYNPEDLMNFLEAASPTDNSTERRVEAILTQAIEDGASDIHIDPKEESFSMFYRVLGVRRLVHEGSLDEYRILATRFKDMSKMDLAERRLPQDGSFTFEHSGRAVDLRVATVPTLFGESIVLRILDQEKTHYSISSLGISGVAEWRKGISRPDGLCLICGPTGSGKTTTLNASIKEMDRFGQSIYTIEDPVEYKIPFVKQVNTNPILGLDFAQALRSFMRADPDVIILGEVRDHETARNAIRAAETGHLVIATLHTESIFGAVQRMKDLGAPEFELKTLLRTVLVQRLVRSVCPSCKGDGCPSCRQSGYAGRTIVSECAYFPDESYTQRMINGEKWWPRMLDDAVAKVKDGTTDKKEIVRIFGAEASSRLES